MNPNGALHPRLIVLAILLSALACSRAVSVGSSPSPVYAVAVTNATNEELIVSYDDGSGPKALGSVRAGAAERFVIAAPARNQVAIAGRNRAGTRSVGPVNVQLVAGETKGVELR
jgi:hypothetical protein